MDQREFRWVKVSVPASLHEELRVEAARREVSLQAVALERLLGGVRVEQPSVPRERPRAPQSVPRERRPTDEAPEDAVVAVKQAVATKVEELKAEGAWAPRDFSKTTQANRGRGKK
jgi:hypothetical protein